MLPIPDFIKPDLNAPRHRKSRCMILDEDGIFIKEFVTKFPKYKGKSKKELLEIIKTFNSLLWNDAINIRDGVELPEGLGTIFIGTCRPSKRYNQNNNLSIKLNSRVGHRNFESDNYTCKIFYSNFTSKYKFSFRELWSFEPCRDFKRNTSKAYVLNWKKYLQVENHIMINKQYKEHFQKHYILNRSAKPDELYNEFDMN